MVCKSRGCSLPRRCGRVSFSRDDTHLLCGARLGSDGTVSPRPGSKAFGRLPAWLRAATTTSCRAALNHPQHPQRPRDAMHGKATLFPTARCPTA